ncbi:MAG: hypothetical protein HIU86_07145 [Acidobacteria bacterium]|nr:hypothetical protein [Acidobacteriota bacterium]
MSARVRAQLERPAADRSVDTAERSGGYRQHRALALLSPLAVGALATDADLSGAPAVVVVTSLGLAGLGLPRPTPRATSR